MPALTETTTATPNAYELFTVDVGGDPSASAKDAPAQVALCIHTARASIELDAHGICVSVFTLDGSEPRDIERCLGAQYIASVNKTGVSAKPGVGGHALFVKRSPEAPPAVLKTAAITGVVYHDDVVTA
jgi:hypothetical protein